MNWVADWMTTCITMFLQHHPPWKCLLYTLQRISSLKRQKPSIFWALRRIPETDNCNIQNSQMLHPLVERTLMYGFRYLKIIISGFINTKKQSKIKHYKDWHFALVWGPWASTFSLQEFWVFLHIAAFMLSMALSFKVQNFNNMN